MSYVVKGILRSTRWNLLLILTGLIFSLFLGELRIGLILIASYSAGWILSLVLILIYEYFSISRLAEMTHASFDEVAYMVHVHGWQKGYIEKHPCSFYSDAGRYLANR